MAGIGGSGKGIQIVVGTDYNDRDLKRAQRDLDQLKAKAAQTATPMQKLGNTLRASVGPALIMAGAAAAAFAVKLAVDGVQAAAEEEKQLAVLKQTLDNVGQGFAMDEVNAFIDNLRFATGVADDELRPAFMKLVGATHDATSAQQLLKVAVDTSAGSGKDLSAVSMAMAKAVAGSSTALKRLVPELDATALAGGGAEKVVAVLSARFGGSAAAAARTFAGQLQRVQDGFQELTESFGKGFLDSLDQAGKTTDVLARSLRDAQPAAEELGKSLGSLVTTLSGSGDNFNAFSYAINQNLGQVNAIVKSIEFSWKALIGAVSGSWPWAETTAVGKSVGELAYEFGHTSKGAKILTDMLGDQSVALGNTAGITSIYEENLASLRAEMNRATVKLGFLAAAFDEASAAMDRRQAMQDYRDALKSFIEDPSGSTRDAAVQAMMDVASSMTDPEDQAKFVSKAFAAITSAAADAGVKVPPDLAKIGTAASDQLDPVASLKQAMEEIPTDITTTVRLNIPNVGALKDNNGNGIPDAFEAAGGYMGSSRYFAGGGRGSDTIPAWLTPGEFVIKAPMVKKWGAALFSQLNAGINPLDGMGVSASRRSSGLTIGSINVASAPGETAEVSLPRALRRMAFLAGV